MMILRKYLKVKMLTSISHHAKATVIKLFPGNYTIFLNYKKKKLIARFFI